MVKHKVNASELPFVFKIIESILTRDSKTITTNCEVSFAEQMMAWNYKKWNLEYKDNP